MSIVFPTQYDHPKVSFTEPGSPVRVLRQGRFSPTGAIVLEVTGEENLYDYIQSFALSTDINYIVSRFTAGDESVLQQRQGLYFDATSMPTTLADALNLVNDGQRAFDLLSVDVKQKFNNSFSEWLASFDTDSWREKMGMLSNPENSPSLVPSPDPVSVPVPSTGGDSLES
ncbi:internal scaffolding protein [Dipodfec virus UOA04_Rod_815]|nr:internal scaffolding protein [Dipodfec virus UOA04_Rod_815]